MRFLASVIAFLLLGASFSAAAQDDRKHIVKKRSANATSAAPFSEAVLAGNTLYISGHLGIDPATGKPGATPEEEARLAMESFKSTVELAGLSMEDVVSVQVFCSDVGFYEAFNGVYRTYFHGNYPARAFIGSGKLLLNARYEIMGIAVKRK